MCVCVHCIVHVCVCFLLCILYRVCLCMYLDRYNHYTASLSLLLYCTAQKGWTYKFTASFLEIYNEQIRDLLGKKSEVHTHEHTHEYIQTPTQIFRLSLPLTAILLSLSSFSSLSLISSCRRKEKSTKSYTTPADSPL